MSVLCDAEVSGFGFGEDAVALIGSLFRARFSYALAGGFLFAGSPSGAARSRRAVTHIL